MTITEQPLLDMALAAKLGAMSAAELEAYQVAQARRIIADGGAASRAMSAQASAMGLASEVFPDAAENEEDARAEAGGGQ